MNAFYNENDPKTAAWLRELIKEGHIAPGIVDERSITEISPKDLNGFTQCHFFAGIGGWSVALRMAGWPDDRPVWTGSCPCQPFSASGSKLGMDDPRHLWPVWFRIIKELHPTTVFGEQVATLAALGWLDQLFDDMEAQDYACAAADLCAASVSADHIRQRLWWVAHTSSERQPEPRIARKDTSNNQTLVFREADRLINAVRRGAMPFLCERHHGLPTAVGRSAIHGFGNAIVPQVAAEFIKAFLEAIE